MPLPKNNSLPSAVDDLGMGNMLSEQVEGETDEMRKKRIAQMQAQQTGGSLATMSLLGGGLGGGYGA